MYRSLLYVPASAPKFIEKAHLRQADAIILDLEDAVAENQKETARANLATAVTQVSQNGASVFVRVNNDPRWLTADVEAAATSGAFGIYLPKVSQVAELDAIDAVLTPIEHALQREPVKVVALVEDALGVLNAQALAQHPRVFAMTAGSEDLATSMGAAPIAAVLHLPKLLVHLAAKAYKRYSFGLLQSIVSYQDQDGMQAAIAEAQRFGFDGATCIHPSIVSFLNDGFSPSEEDIAFAERLLAAAEKQTAQGIGAFNFEGEFVDAPIIQRAQQLLQRMTPRKS